MKREENIFNVLIREMIKDEKVYQRKLFIEVKVRDRVRKSGSYITEDEIQEMIRKFVNGTDGLLEIKIEREITLRRWSKLGLLDGLSGHAPENTAILFEPALSFTLSLD